MIVSAGQLVEQVLFGSGQERRLLQDSPILGDVWIDFAYWPTAPRDLLITSASGYPAGPVAAEISKGIRKLNLPRQVGEEPNLSYLTGFVVARLFFREVVQVVVPMTQWWRNHKVQEGLRYYTPEKLQPIIKTIIAWAQARTEDMRARLAGNFTNFSSLDRFVALAGVILWAGSSSREKANADVVTIGELLGRVEGPDAIIDELKHVFIPILADARIEEEQRKRGQVWQIALNRRAWPALQRSVPAVKGDAARTLFAVNCSQITWAVLDSGIDGTHPAFKDEYGSSRIVRTLDFSSIRQIVNFDNLDLDMAGFREWHRYLLSYLRKPLTEMEVINILRELANDAYSGRPIHWGSVEQLIDIDPEKKLPQGGHGTHVAGIIGARAVDQSGYAAGMCPDIKLYDFRVLSESPADTEFAVISALQYIRYLNESRNYISIHGANLSLSIPFDVRNFACGRTPICEECERLVGNGVVVVAAAGNLGYQRFVTREGVYEGTAGFSITDPGNADGVITVGATHKSLAHTYGVSYFSSRGPTADGRLKPDLVAPGERIQSCLPNQDWGELDGTSMAAPHVSGAAAMLMARYSDLIGEPRRIKRLLCENATDLERERSFQGHGMLDVLRAMQQY